MIHVVEAGPNYAAETLIPDYVVGGKTGTAQIWDQQAGAWMTDTYNHTFVGFVGSDKPEAVILVRIHDTDPRVKRSWGMTLEMSSNELWRRVAMDAITDDGHLRPLRRIRHSRRRPTEIQPYPADQQPPQHDRLALTRRSQ